MHMIGYTTIGTNDLPRATAFYDELFAVMGIKRLMDFGTGYAWGKDMASPGFGVMKPYNGQPATVGNGVMIALLMSSKDKVNEIHAKAMALGGTDEGAPGPRGEGFYAAYFRDLDGNKLNAFFMG
jgi:catechol 2,3-dioxygenase-like lactoylglutathione lyase family enzyme